MTLYIFRDVLLEMFGMQLYIQDNTVYCYKFITYGNSLHRQEKKKKLRKIFQFEILSGVIFLVYPVYIFP